MARLVKTCDPQVYLLAMEFARDQLGDIPEYRLMQLSLQLQQTLEDWCEEYAEEQAAYANDPHERAAARARSNNFADTNGRDWT